jgi:hypothetical protein
VSQNSLNKEYYFTVTNGSSSTTLAKTDISGTGCYAASCTNYFEDARTTKVKVLANRVNLFPDPSVTYSDIYTGWVNVGTSVTSAITTSGSNAYIGNTYLSITIPASTALGAGVYYTSTTRQILVTPGKYYAFSGFMKQSSGAAVNFQVQVTWLDTLGNPITVTGLTVGQTYTFTVTATNGGGSSSP